MKKYRSERVADLVTREIAQILEAKIADPRLQLVTITASRVTRDIRIARVYYTVRGADTDPAQIQQALKNAAGYIRKELGKVLELRYIPEIRFEFDKSLEYGNRIWEQLEAFDDETDDGE
jgi:ribosome-binding factor A